MKIVVGHLYPDYLNIYADRGNMAVLAKRAAWRGIGFEYRGIGLGEPLRPGEHDLLYVGGGQDREQALIAPDLASRAAELEEAIWDRLHFATHLRSQRLGEFTVGTELHRSESLALVQLLILYHVVTARAAIALGGTGTRADSGVHPVDAREQSQAVAPDGRAAATAPSA